MEAAYALSVHQDFESCAREIFDRCKEVTGATAGYVALLNEDGSENEVLFLDAGGDECDVDSYLPMPIRGFRSEVYRDMISSYVNGFMDRDDYVRYMPSGHVRLENVLFAPLLIEDKAVGLLGLSNKEGGFNKHDLDLATRFAELAAISLKNSQALGGLEDAKRTLEQIAKGAFDAIMLIDEQGRVVFVNDVGKALLDDPNPIGTTLYDMLGIAQEQLQTGISTISITEPNGKKRHLETSVAENNGLARRPVVIRDVTDAVEQRKSLEIANRKLDIMGRATRHDVMNHLMVLEGYANLFFDENVPMKPEHGEVMKESLTKMRALFDMQRNFEMLGTLQPSWRNLETIIEASKRNLIQDDVQISVDVPGYEILSDELIEKAFYNLIGNSIAHAEGMTALEISATVEDGNLILVFEDDGHGIDIDEKEEIFRLGRGRGSGQGLFLVREILTANGMTITEKGEPGKGARFIIEVPSQSWR